MALARRPFWVVVQGRGERGAMELCQALAVKSHLPRCCRTLFEPQRHL